MRVIKHIAHAGLAWIAFWLWPTAHATAEPPRRTLGFAVDTGVASNRDDLIVPRASSGPRLGLSGRYAGVMGPGTLHVQLHLAAAYVLDRDGNPGLAIDHAIGADYVFDLGQRDGLRQAVGPAIGADTDVAGLVSWDNAHAYWIATRWIGVSWRAHMPAWQGWRWDVGIEVPAFGLLSRPPSYRHNKQDALNHVGFYLFDVQSDPTPVWFTELQQLRVAVDLWKGDSANFVARGWALGVETRFAHAVEPQSAFAIRTTLRFTATWEL
jgi:hypothetical protein